MNIAILVPSQGNPKETFIQNHILHLPFSTKVIYGGVFPYKCDEIKENRYWRFLLNKLNYLIKSKEDNITIYKKKQLEKCLKYLNIKVVIAEYLITGGYVVDVCKKHNIPLIATSLGYDISQYEVLETNMSRYKKLFNYSKSIIIVSNHMKKTILNIAKKDIRIKYSPIGATDDFFKITPTFKTKQLFALGRFVEKKAPYLTILAFNKALKIDNELTLIFGGDGPLLNLCKDLVKAFGLENKVTFLGEVNQSIQKQELKNSFAFIQHSKVAENGDSEGTPVAILEACASGIPIISTFHAGINDVVVNERTGLLCLEGDVNKMAENIVKLSSNIDLTKKMGSEGRKYVKDNFSLKQHIEDLIYEIER